MSRIGLSQRLAHIVKAAERINPRAVAVYRMLPATRLRYDNWRVECDRINADHVAQHGQAGAYEAFLDGKSETPEPPGEVVRALGSNDQPVLTNNMDADQIAEIYRSMIEDITNPNGPANKNFRR